MTDQTTALRELLEKVERDEILFRMASESPGEPYPNRCHLKGREVQARRCAEGLRALIAEQEQSDG